MSLLLRTNHMEKEGTNYTRLQLTSNSMLYYSIPLYYFIYIFQFMFHKKLTLVVVFRCITYLNVPFTLILYLQSTRTYLSDLSHSQQPFNHSTHMTLVQIILIIYITNMLVTTMVNSLNRISESLNYVRSLVRRWWKVAVSSPMILQCCSLKQTLQ